MKKTVFITGASSGIGKETAIKFSQMGWNVVATMRNPEKETELKNYDSITLLRLDVLEKDSIEFAVKKTIELYGAIDVLVNNAGYYSIGVVEAMTEAEISRQLETNLIGLIYVTKAVLPYMRKARKGVILNVSSVAGRTTVPLQTIYHASKWGVEGFTESLQYEVEPFGIKVSLIEPGVIKTDFYNRSMQLSENKELTDYQEFSNQVSRFLINGGNQGSSPKEIGERIYQVAISKKIKLRYPVGKSTAILYLYKLLPSKIYRNAIKSTMIKE